MISETHRCKSRTWNGERIPNPIGAGSWTTWKLELAEKKVVQLSGMPPERGFQTTFWWLKGSLFGYTHIYTWTEQLNLVEHGTWEGRRISLIASRWQLINLTGKKATWKQPNRIERSGIHIHNRGLTKSVEVNSKKIVTVFLQWCRNNQLTCKWTYWLSRRELSEPDPGRLYNLACCMGAVKVSRMLNKNFLHGGN